VEPIRHWWANVPSWARPVILAAAVGAVAWILTKAIPSVMKLWLDHLVERTIRRIDRGLAKRVPRGANIFERDIKAYLGVWRPLRFMVMRRLEERGLVFRLPDCDGALWLRRA
jgi:hypothetical protein